MERSVLASVLVIGVVAAMLGAGTVALFNDTEKSEGTFTAGTMDLKIDGKDDPNVFQFNLADLKPGDSGSQVFVCSNAGIDGDLSISVSAISEDCGTTPEPENKIDGEPNADLAASIDVVLWVDSDRDGIKDVGEVLHKDTLATLGGASHTNIATLPPNLDVYFEWSIDSAVGNEIMDDSASFDMTFSLAQ